MKKIVLALITFVCINACYTQDRTINGIKYSKDLGVSNDYMKEHIMNKSQ